VTAATSATASAVESLPVGLFEGLCSTRAIRRYTDDPVPDEALRDMLFAATRAPSGSNRQPFRFLVLRDGEKAVAAKRLVADAAQNVWVGKQRSDGYGEGSGARPDSPKARMAATMQHYVDHFAEVPVLVFACLERYRPEESYANGNVSLYTFDGSSLYPAVQNLLLAARALGFGGALTGFHMAVETELRELLGIPDNVLIGATITLGKPMGSHGSVRRRPMGELIYGDTWGEAPSWAVDPEGTRFTQAGPPRT
jgi:nitroreductase